MYFDTKNTFKNNRNHTLKHSLSQKSPIPFIFLKKYYF